MQTKHFVKHILTYATMLTLVRVIVCPFIVIAFLQQWWRLAFGLFVAAVITDGIDGLVARHYNQITMLGALLDPLADKILIITVLGLLTFSKTPLLALPVWFFWFVVLKECILIAGVVLVKIYRKRDLVIVPTIFGKIAMFVQVIFIGWIFSCYFFTSYCVHSYHWIIAIVSLCVLLSLIDYTKQGIHFFTNNQLKK